MIEYISNQNSDIEPILKRASLFLEDGDFAKANEYCERVLDADPENAVAYLGKLLVDLKVKKSKDLLLEKNPFESNINYEKIIRFGDEKIVSAIKEYNMSVTYQRLERLMNMAETEEQFSFVAQEFEKISGYKDASDLAKECTEKIEWVRKENLYKAAIQLAVANTVTGYQNAAKQLKQVGDHRDAIELSYKFIEKAEAMKKDEIYDSAIRLISLKTITGYENAIKQLEQIADYKDAAVLMEKCHGQIEFMKKDEFYSSGMRFMSMNTVEGCENAIRQFQLIPGHRDSNEKIVVCQQMIEDIKVNAVKAEEKKTAGKKKLKKILIISGILAVVIAVAIFVIIKFVVPEVRYSNALNLYKNGKYTESIKAFKKLDDYKDSEDKVLEVTYAHAENLFENKKFEDSIYVFEELGDYKDSKERIIEVNYGFAEFLFEEGEYTRSLGIFTDYSDYKDSKKYLTNYSRSSTVSAGYGHTVVLKDSKILTAIGYNEDNECDVYGWSDIAGVGAGVWSTIGIKNDGSVSIVGWDSYNQCDASGWSDIVQASGGFGFNVGLKSNGTVVAVGDNGYGQCDVWEWNDITFISTSQNHTVGVKKDGTVVATGNNDYGQCNVYGWNDIVAVAAGYDHTIGLKADGTVVYAGDTSDGRYSVKDWEDIVMISSGAYFTVGLKSDGTVVATGNNTDSQCNVSSWSDIVAISCGNYHTVGLKADGSLVATGWNDYGQCDVWSIENVMMPKIK